MAIPRGRKDVGWYFRQANTYDILGASFTAIIGLSSAYNFNSQGRPGLALIVGLATVALLVFGLVKNGVLLMEAANKESIHELEGCLLTLHAALDPTAIEDTGRVRLALHVPVDGDKLEQVTDLHRRHSQKGRIGRQFPADAGIIGRAYQEQQPFVSQRVNDDRKSYIQELINDWHYESWRAPLLNPETKGWSLMR